MNDNLPKTKNPFQDVLFWFFSTNGRRLRRLYFKRKLFHGGTFVSLDNMMTFLGLSCLFDDNGREVYRFGDSFTGKEDIDNFLQEKYNKFREHLLTVTKEEYEVLKFSHSSGLRFVTTKDDFLPKEFYDTVGYSM